MKSRGVVRICAAPAPNSSSRCSGRPQRAGGVTPAGGGTCRPTTPNSRPMKPAGVQLARPMRAAAAHDAQHLAGRARVVRREHHAERRQHRVEGAVVEGQRLDVGLAEGDRQPLGGGAAAAVLEQGRHVVGRRHVAPAAGRRQRAVAVARGHVQHLRARPQVDRLAQRLADDLQRRADDPEVARRPGRLLASA